MSSAMWSVASTISVRYRLSCRIQEPCFFEHGRSDQRFQSVLRYQIHFPPEEMRQIQHQAGVVHQIDVGIRQKGDQHVDIAVGAHVAAGGGPEKRKLPHAVSFAEICQLGLIELRVTELERAPHVLFPLLCPTPWRVGQTAEMLEALALIGVSARALLKGLRDAAHADPLAELPAMIGNLRRIQSLAHDCPEIESASSALDQAVQDLRHGNHAADWPAHTIPPLIAPLAAIPDVVLAPGPAPRYWQPNDPVLLLTGQGVHRSDRHGQVAPLPCRVLKSFDLEAASRTLAFDQDLRKVLDSELKSGWPTRKTKGDPWHPLFFEWEVAIEPRTGNVPPESRSFPPNSSSGTMRCARDTASSCRARRSTSPSRPAPATSPGAPSWPPTRARSSGGRSTTTSWINSSCTCECRLRPAPRARRSGSSMVPRRNSWHPAGVDRMNRMNERPGSRPLRRS